MRELGLMAGGAVRCTLIYDEFYWRQEGQVKQISSAGFPSLSPLCQADRPSSFKFAGPGRPTATTAHDEPVLMTRPPT